MIYRRVTSERSRPWLTAIGSVERKLFLLSLTLIVTWRPSLNLAMTRRTAASGFRPWMDRYSPEMYSVPAGRRISTWCLAAPAEASAMCSSPATGHRTSRGVLDVNLHAGREVTDDVLGVVAAQAQAELVAPVLPWPEDV